ncbi:trans-aconitate methyltransferase 1 [Coemansia sp. RSA 989]|nr:S-adenosyl-L-methionine-dependent methyltransferase [Coemansia mojavensis]KAJ1747030.1 trans-aconitate methyltransferase 1 [Coemansia sp. RSA 1821]KAJ1861007.1 trans-aconitate methyltransferase 1 [Coemansia sp. RSA 989]KAJ1869071.1 trans-aconitate methyltransferase 1 [Coemansia sp. RSA 990]KAJ2648991.1 trans-aconitate methyltransferase 1 [Coemansia sp. RSA 1250]KAJ2671356.1 trans-aconitate methyltransferase 1 [Coemansia sp. RSA 1085]
MSAFASKGFNAGAYLALRPKYNEKLMNWIVSYHSGPQNTAVDVACGPGTFTVDLAAKFKLSIGLDPSPSMIHSAQEHAQAQNISNVEFKQGFGESLPFESDSVDLITVMQGAHWFKIDQFLDEALRVLRPGGTLAMVGYDYPEIADWPKAMNGRDFARKLATDNDLLCRYWDSGFKLIGQAYGPYAKSIMQQQKFKDVCHVCYPKELLNVNPDMSILPEPWIDSKSTSLDTFREYLKTWSAYKKWKDENPATADIIDNYFDSAQAQHSLTGQETAQIEWSHFAIVARKPK